MIKKYKNFLEKENFEEIWRLVTSSDFNWNYIESCSGRGSRIDFCQDVDFHYREYGFFNTFFNYKDKKDIKFSNIVKPIIDEISKDLEIFHLIRVRVGMQTYIGDKNFAHGPHVDYFFPHKTLIYYVECDDGDTIFYKGEMKNDGGSLEVMDRVSPERNSAVVFDGLIIHGSSSPFSTSRRIAITINYLDNKEDLENFANLGGMI